MFSTEDLKTAIGATVIARRNAAARLREAGNPRDPFRALPGMEQQFFEAAQSVRSYDLVLNLLEREVKREARKRAGRTAQSAAAFLITAGLIILATLGFAAALLLMRCPAPAVSVTAFIGVAVSLGWAVIRKVAAKLTELNGGATTTEAGKTEIMGKAKASAQQMALFARSKNAEPQLPACSLEQLAQFFLEEGEAEGVRGDVAFAQSLHETGFFKYGGIVLPTQNNYAGIGALNGNAKGQAATFPDPRTGVRAQIQHLKAYASKEALVNGCVDPRFSLVTRGSAQYVEWLGASDNPNGKGWAVPGKGYGGKIVALLGQIMAFEVPQPSAPSEPEEQEPEFPAYQLEGLETLTEAGVINSPEFWRQKFGEQVTVGEMFGILGKLFTKVTE